MSLGRRVTWIVAGAVAVAVALTALASYVAVSRQLRDQADRELRLQAAAVQRIVAVNPAAARGAAQLTIPMFDAPTLPNLGSREGGPLGTVQAFTATGRPRTLLSVAGPLPAVEAVDRAVAAGRRGTLLRTVTAGGERYRVITVPVGSAGAVQIGKSLAGADAVVRQLVLALLLISTGGVAVGIVMSRVLTARATAPVRSLAAAADRIARTDDLSLRIPPGGDDELGQLARRFNAMLDALQASRAELAGSVAAQRQLVADASHELRTPITSLRTNLEVLLEGGELTDDARRSLLSSLVEQTSELGALVADVIELARGEATTAEFEPVDLDAIVVEQVARMQRHFPGVVFTVHREPVTVDGAADRIARAVANLLDNAAKHSGAGGLVEVTVDHDGVRVRDHGPGIDPQDLPHLFDRFYRGASARSMPGTGLGLAIVRQVAETHGWRVHAENVGAAEPSDAGDRASTAGRRWSDGALVALQLGA